MFLLMFFFRIVIYKGECYTAPECAARSGISNSSCARQEILYKRVNHDFVLDTRFLGIQIWPSLPVLA